REQAALLDITEEAILVRDLQGHILFWNHGAEKVYGWKPEEAIGKNMGDFISPRQEDDYEKAEQETLAKGSWSGELNQVTKAGERVVIESNWTLMPNKDGKPKSILIINTDVTIKKKFEVHLLRTQRMEGIGRLASGIAHDLNNVLSPIILSMQILRKKTSDPKIRSLVSTLENSAHRGANLVKRLLSFARGAEGERVPVQIKHQIEEIGKLLNQTFPKNITINMDVAKNLWFVNGDATQLHQVLLNLCVNSRDAMEANSEGLLNISASNVILDEAYCRINPEAKPDHYLKLTVTDTGAGIPPEILDNIYEPFFTTKAPGHGTGLGLSTVFSIVKSHNGFITVYSEVGKGTAFNIYLPAVDAADEHIDEALQTDFPRGKGELILIVDDESIIREVAKEALESFGYEVITASDGGDAVGEYLKNTQKVAAVLLDVMMPNVDGISCMIALKKLNPDLKIIITSGLGTNKSMLDNPVATNCKFLEKPFTVDSLIKILQEVLSQ
ncbi:MAG: PAS domain S-box protein, partial [Chlorobiales bacterium]|nr:PAS domain S-box protein [Chlorobiales bacterium]